MRGFIIEHVIERLPIVADGHPSPLEQALGAALRPLAKREVVWILDFPPHGTGAGIEEDTRPDLEEFRGLLEAGAGHLAVVQAAVAEEARQAAIKVRGLAAFAACRPAARLDRPAEQVGAAAAASRAARPAVLTEVSEWAADEVAATLGLSPRAAGALLADAVTLVEQLPATLAALEAGTIGFAAARMLAAVLAPLAADTRGQVEAGLLAHAGGATLAQLKARAHRAVLRADAGAALARAATAVRERQVRLFADGDGMVTLSAAMPAPLATACYAALEAYAQACATPGDPRTKAQRMVDCLGELILNPGVNGQVQVQLTVITPADTLAGGDEPGEVDGHPVPAGMVRELAYTLGLLPRPTVDAPADPPATEPEGTADASGPTEPAEPAALDALAAPAEAAGPAAPAEPAPVGRAGRPPGKPAGTDLAALLGLPAGPGGVLTAAPTIAITDEISGQLVALTTTAEIRRTATCRRRPCRTGRRPCTHPPSGAGLGPPPATAGYRPAAGLDTFVRHRDRRCRFPGCRAPAIACDLDHTTPWPHGATSADNLCCLCRHHHRLSHQAPGWRLHHLPDGGLRWTLPGGDTRTTYPPRYGTDDTDLPPSPTPAPDPPPVVIPPATIDDDPAPF